MPRIAASLLLLTAGLSPLLAADEPIVVSTDHPRLFLRPQRLRLLRRERERQSMRWQQFEALVGGNAPMTEPGFALALYYEVSSDQSAGRKAIAWALSPSASDLRQLALVYDWCQPLLSDMEKRSLAARVLKGITDPPADDSISTERSRALAAVALFDEVPQGPQHELERLAYTWWRNKIARVAQSGRNPVPREDAYPLMELLHAFQDNANVDLRETARGYFKDFPIDHLMSYYPAPFQGAENDFYVGAMRRPADPDLRLAALSRAADLAMVAYDVNGPESQVIQGWLMHDRYLMRGAFGTPYEFLWANPYQPGLSYYNVPLVFYNSDLGRLYARSSWEDNAEWFGMFDGVMQRFADGHPTALNPQGALDPIDLHEAVICFARAAAGGRPIRLKLEDEEPVFVVGLEPHKLYSIEVDDEEMFEAAADPGGILELDDVPSGREIAVRIAEAAAQTR
ncbi:MAG TPA: hypothetical protein VKB88_12825 [Bryobacteraceae bacterium]|nr:hypothetical protein [Bryobacteraceae bacterium]